MPSNTPVNALAVKEAAASFDPTILLITLFFFLFFVTGAAVIGVFFYMREKKKGREERSLDSSLLRIRVPKTNEVKIDAIEQFFSTLSSIKKRGWRYKYKLSMQPTLSFEIVAMREEIRFYVWAPNEFRDLVEKQINGAYPDAEISVVDEYNIFNEQGKVAYKSFSLKKENYYPIKTYRELPTDPLSTLTSAMAKMGKDEAAAVQIIVAPTESDWAKMGKGFVSSTKKQESNPEKAKFSTPARILEAVDSKISKPGFEVTINIVTVANDEASAKAHLGNLSSVFEMFAGDTNNFTSRSIKNKGQFVEDFLYRYQPIYFFHNKSKTVLNTEELATIFHFPNRQITTPHIDWLYSRTAPAPAQIPTSGLYLGKSSYRGVEREVYLGEEDRMRHMYIIGKTGTGKSELLKDIIMQDIRNGKGLCFLDPHGDAVKDILEMIPPERAEDVIYFNPSDLARPMGLNLLEAKTEDQKHFAANVVINMMYKLFDPYKTGIVGPRFEHAVRNAMLTVMSEDDTSFIEVVRVLTDANFVQELLPKVKDPIVRRYWTDQIAQTSDFHKSEVLDYIVSKFGRFITNRMIRNIIGQSRSSFSFREAMDTGKILLVNLSKGDLGEENSNFLGLILVPRILMAAMSRSDTPEDQRRDFFLYVDEFQNFATPDFATILSEARKYRLGLCVANQFVGQMDEEVKNAVFGNVGTMISFRTGVTDANYLQHEFAPVFSEEDLLNIERFHVFIKTIVKNEPVTPFSMSLYKDMNSIKESKNPRVAEIITEMSRLKYGRDLQLVEAEIGRRAKL